MNGLFAAVATPVRDRGGVDVAALDRILEFLLAAGVDGVCIGGATSEYPHFETAERLEVLQHTAARVPPGRALLVGIGAPSTRLVLELGRAALDAGSRALLLPMPMFFHYEQDDLHAFCAHVSGALRGPCLLYDLPDFTNGLTPETTVSLLRNEEYVVGIKDSSGRAEHLAAFAAARGAHAWTLLVGDDRLLRNGLDAGWNGGVSGVAGFCPELLVALYHSVRDGRQTEALRLQALLDELIARMAAFPTPWAIRMGLAARGLPTGPLPLPLTPRRRQQADEFQKWFKAFLDRC